MSKEKLYFLSIQSLTLLNKYLEEKNYDILSNYVKIYPQKLLAKMMKKKKYLKLQIF